LVRELQDELLVYDLDRHEAHCLNRTAGIVWRHCDGQTTAAQLATCLQEKLQVPADEAMVWLALDRLGRAGLLQERVTAAAGAPVPSRREAMRKFAHLGGASVLLPLVTSILVPTPAQAATCIDQTACEAINDPACPGTPICGDPGVCCKVGVPFANCEGSGC
jgi:hypothetical protein